MPTPIVLPHLGESVESATLVAWHKAAGETVKRGEEIADVETDKAVMPLEAPHNGVLLAILVPAGSTVNIGQQLAWIGREGETLEAPKSAQPVTAQSTNRAAEVATRRKISPLARRMAHENGIDLDRVQPSASDKISSREIRRYLDVREASVSSSTYPEQTQKLTASPAFGVLPHHRVPLSSVRKATGRRMLESAQTIPQFAVSVNVDASQMLMLRDELAAAGSSVSITALLLSLTADALIRYPQANARIDGSDLIVYETVNIGVAVASEDGLRVPVLRGVQTLALHEIQTQLTALAEKARAGKLTPDEIDGATFSVSNLGMFGVASVTPLVNPPQAAILGVGATQPLFVPGTNAQPRLIQQMTLTLSADHRALDGADAAGFLKTLRELVENCRAHFMRRL